MAAPTSRSTLLVTGATGFVGRHLVRHDAARRWDLVVPGSAALDITRREAVRAAIAAAAPDAVIHLAYRKADRPTIVDGSQHVAEAAAEVGARLVHVSTDLVFPGRATAYTELDAPCPITEYGHDKLVAERAVAEAAPDAVIVRTSLVYGTDEPSPAQIELVNVLRSGAPHTPHPYFTDEFRCPVHADDLAVGLLELAARRDVRGPLHVAGPELVDRFELAVRFAHSAGLGRSVGAIRASTIAESGLDRPSRIELDVSTAAALGLHCRPVSAVLPST